MPRKPKPKNALSAGQRAALYEKEHAQKSGGETVIEAQGQSKTEAESGDGAKSTKNNTEISGKSEENFPGGNHSGRRKPEKKKPQYACVKVDFSIPTSKIKPVHGFCNGPVSQEGDISSLYREIGVPFVRFHDTDHNISRYAIDISRIFPNFDADENDPENYRFAYTDKYIAAAYSVGARVIYRLGESIDAERLGGYCVLPRDIDKWISVCVHIIRHYNDYWADGFAYGLEYFEIWNEPDNPECIDSHENTEIFGFYGRVAKGLKLYNQNLKVGGMAFMGYNDMSRDFIKYCAKNKAPLDFFSFHAYLWEPEEIQPAFEKFLPLLHNLGLEDTELILDEWNFIERRNDNINPWVYIKNENGRFSAECRDIFETQKGIKGAAFAAAFMIKLNTADKLSAACYYDGQPSISRWCGICDRYGNPSKTFYSLKAYGKLYRAATGVACVSEQYDGMLHTGIYACAALDDGGKGYVMLASFDGCGMVDLRLDMLPENAYTADIYLTDGVKNLELCDSVPLSGLKKRLLLNMSAYGVALIEIY